MVNSMFISHINERSFTVAMALNQIVLSWHLYELLFLFLNADFCSIALLDKTYTYYWSLD